MNHVLKRCLFILSIIIFTYIFPKTIIAQVVINEFSSGSSSDWVELYNKGPDTVSLTSYRIRDSGTSNKKDLSGDIPVGSFLTISFSNYLNVGGDIVKLLRFSGESEELLERIPYGSEGGVCAPGENGSIGMFTDGNLPYVRFLNSTSNSSNNSAQEDPCPSPTPTSMLTPTPTLTSTQVPTTTPILVTYDNIYINEFIPDPESGNEKVEIKNTNNFSVSLVNWQIDDIENGGHSPKTFSAEISPSGLFTLDLGTNSFLNNDGDSVRLLDFNGIQKDKKDYSSSSKNKSWSKDGNGNWCELDSSFNSGNNGCPSSTAAPTSSPVPSSTPKPTVTPKLSITPKPALTGSSLSATASAEEVLGTDSSKQPIIETSNNSGGENLSNVSSTEAKNSSGILPILFIAPGTLMIGFAIFMFIKSKHKVIP